MHVLYLSIDYAARRVRVIGLYTIIRANRLFPCAVHCTCSMFDVCVRGNDSHMSIPYDEVVRLLSQATPSGDATYDDVTAAVESDSVQALGRDRQLALAALILQRVHADVGAETVLLSLNDSGIQHSDTVI